MSTLNTPPEQTDNYKYIIEKIKQYVNRRINEVFGKYDFLKTIQMEGESIEHFLTECRHLAKSCDYNFVGTNESHFETKLLLESESR